MRPVEGRSDYEDDQDQADEISSHGAVRAKPAEVAVMKPKMRPSSSSPPRSVEIGPRP